jgi:VanZ family protein
LIIGLSVTPGVARPDDNLFSWLYAGTPPTAQKVLHIIMYGLLAFLWVWTLASIESTRLRLGISLLLTLGLGFALEWYQTRVPGRFGTLVDALLNAVGALIGVVVAVLLI